MHVSPLELGCRGILHKGSCTRKIPLRECASGSIALQKRLTEVFWLLGSGGEHRFELESAPAPSYLRVMSLV